MDIGAVVTMGLGLTSKLSGFKSRHTAPVKKADNHYKIENEAKLQCPLITNSQVADSKYNCLAADKAHKDDENTGYLV